MINTFSEINFKSICDKLLNIDPDLKYVIEKFGYPPMWTRPNTLESLIHIILEQQVSLASAKAALTKLQEKLKSITTAKLLLLSDTEFKECYFSRQKTGYVRSLAHAVENGFLNLEKLLNLSDDEVRASLTALKGIGNWTADIYLMFVLQRSDIFPIGDLAAVNALKTLKKFNQSIPKEIIIQTTDLWKPNRTIATMILWHYYLSVRAK